jgi:hypothetical protein
MAGESSAAAAPLLPPEDLASQLSTIEVLLSIYNGSADIISNDDSQLSLGDEEQEDDVVLSPESYKAIQSLAKFLSLPLEQLGQPPSIALRDGLPAVIQLGIKLDPLRGTLNEGGVQGQGENTRRHLLLNIGLVLRRLTKAEDGKQDDLLKPRWSLKQPDWLDRPSYDVLCQAAKGVECEVDESVGYIMNIIEVVSEASLDYISKDNNSTKADGNEESSVESGEVVRTWHLFPSLSMKDKRKDLVSYASRYNLTGFVLAGKPGLVVLEHTMQATAEDSINVIDSYWSDIKTTSWSDLPPGHKKVSEKHREVGVARCFHDMQDVTSIDEIGSASIIENGRVRKNDLDKIKVWLQSRDCVGQLDIVLGKE